MTDTETIAKLDHLRGLLVDYSFPEKRHAGMLAEIDALLRWALRDLVRPGARAAEVEAILGPPYGTVGEQSAGVCQWLYPSINSAAEAREAPQWFFTLRFERSILQSIERRGWTD